MSLQPSSDPLIQQLQLLLTGYSYNFYNVTNLARSDDMLVRERASYFLTQAVNQFTTLRGNFQRRFVPPLTRDNPLPPQEALAQLRDMEETQQSISRLESHIRGMSVPSQDRIWWRFRQEQALLEKLLNFDLGLIRSSEQLYQTVGQISPESWQAYGAGLLTPYIQQLSRLTSEREQFLLLQV